MNKNQPSRLELEVEEFYTLPTETLTKKRIEFQNIRLIIKNELLSGKASIKGREWAIKARAAYDINGVKISIIDTIIGERNEGKRKLYKDFYKAAHDILPDSYLEVIKVQMERNNQKVLELRG